MNCCTILYIYIEYSLFCLLREYSEYRYYSIYIEIQNILKIYLPDIHAEYHETAIKASSAHSERV